jgi:hypothetical protein
MPYLVWVFMILTKHRSAQVLGTLIAEAFRLDRAIRSLVYPLFDDMMSGSRAFAP